MNKIRLWLTVLLVPLDLAGLLLSIAGAYFLRTQYFPTEGVFVESLATYLTLGLWAGIGGLVIFAVFGLYRFKYLFGFELFGKIAGAVIVWIALIIVALFALKETVFSRLIIGLLAGVAIVVIYLLRLLWGELIAWLNHHGMVTERVLLIGSKPDVLSEIKKFFTANPGWGAKVVGALEHTDFDAVEAKVVSTKATSLLIAESIPEELAERYFRYAESANLQLRYFPSIARLVSTNFAVTAIAGYPILELKSTPLEGWGRVTKRLMDVGLGGVAMLILSPVMLLVALAVKLDSKGPVIYKQKRVGERGESFTFYKFRSMRAELSPGLGGKEAEALLEKLRRESNEGAGLLFKMKDDPRITRVGKFIRKTSLDELPQLWNVLKGEMSLVGPRPPLPEEVEKYTSDLKRRLLVKPGITGLWQVSGRSDASFDDYLKLDLYYVERWSIWLDLWILLKTIQVILLGKGSY